MNRVLRKWWTLKDTVHLQCSALGLPGLRFLHDGQFEGLRRFAACAALPTAQEPLDEGIHAFYRQILPAFAQSPVSKGDGRILTPVRAWDDNPSSQCINVIEWQEHGKENHFDLVVVNMAPHRAQCRVHLGVEGLRDSIWHMGDRLGEERWTKDGNELATQGLYLDVAPRGAHLYSFTREVVHRNEPASHPSGRFNMISELARWVKRAIEAPVPQLF